MAYIFADSLMSIPRSAYLPWMGRPAGSKNKYSGGDRFPTCYEVDEQTGCWNWTKSRGSHGYGDFRRDGHKLAHRWSYAMFNGPIPDGAFVLHRCDNRRCVNPAHLFLGTADDNAKDMSAKGRQYSRGKTFEELFGEERAAEMKDRLRQWALANPKPITPEKRAKMVAGMVPGKPRRHRTSQEKAAHSAKMKAWWAAKKGRST